MGQESTCSRAAFRPFTMSTFRSWEAEDIPCVLGQDLCGETWTLPVGHGKTCVMTLVYLAAGFHRPVEFLGGRNIWMSLI